MVFLDPDAYAWKRVRGRPDSSYRIDHEMCVLGYDRAAGTIDLLIRFDDRGGHCQAHRHVTTTTVLVLQGEQHLDEMRPDGVVHKVRRTGEYHLTTGDPHPHRERGGPEGGVLFFSHHTTDGRLYEIVDDNNNVVHTVTIDSLIDSWENQL
jgi:hypothetical protein